MIAEWFDDVTIYFSDIVGFTNICSVSGPLQVCVKFIYKFQVLLNHVISITSV